MKFAPNMNNYKEIVAALREKESRDNRELLDAAADVIEQQKAAIERLEAESRGKEQYIAETIGKVIIERNAAIADFETFAKTALDNPFACNFCKHEAGEYCKWKKQNGFDKDGCFGRYFEWRGAKMDEVN